MQTPITPTAMLQQGFNENFAERFWSKVNTLSGPVPKLHPELDHCWEWTATLSNKGYGLIGGAYGKTMCSNRLAWRLTYGELAPKQCVLHKCDNPKCCRGTHLFLGTKRVNIHDAILKGRGKGGFVTPESVIEIRTMYSSGEFTQGQIALVFGIDQSYVSRVVGGYNGPKWFISESTLKAAYI